MGATVSSATLAAPVVPLGVIGGPVETSTPVSGKRKEISVSPEGAPLGKNARPGSEEHFNESLGATEEQLQELEDSALQLSQAPAQPEGAQALPDPEVAPADEEAQGNGEARGGEEKIKVPAIFACTDIRCRQKAKRLPPSPGQVERRERSLSSAERRSLLNQPQDP